jgi:microcystin-dependent protein
MPTYGVSPTATFKQTNSTSPTGGASGWLGDHDGNMIALQPAAGFQITQQSSPNMTVLVAAGAIFDGQSTSWIAAQTLTVGAAPGNPNQRYDLVSVQLDTGVASLTAGTAASSATPPAVPAGAYPLAIIFVNNGTSSITNSLISDCRSFIFQPLTMRIDQAASTTMLVRNMRAASSVAAALSAWETATSNSKTTAGVFDNTGAPYFGFKLGSGINHSYWDGADFTFRNQAGSSQYMSVTSSGVVLNNATGGGMGAGSLNMTGQIYINGAAFIGVPTGTIVDFAATSPPTGWLICNGAAVNRVTYAALFAVIGTTFGAGDGSTTFNLPDCRGRVTAGWDSGNTSARLNLADAAGVSASSIGNVGGEQVHALITAELAIHAHAVSDPGHFHTVIELATDGNPTLNVTGSPGQFRIYNATGNTSNVKTGITVSNSGNGTPHNIIQPTIIFNKIIRT